MLCSYSKYYLFIFNRNRGETISTVKVYCGDKLRAGDVPSVTDPETFEGWFYDLEYQLPFDPDDQIFLYTPVYAKRSTE